VLKNRAKRLVHWASLFLFVALASSRPCSAQDLTAVGLQTEVDSVMKQLNTLGANLGGDFSIATSGAASQLSALMNQLNKIVGDKVTVPLNSLGLDAQNLGRQIHAGVGQINQILTTQRNCGVANAQFLISGLRNVAAGTLGNIPLVKVGDPQVYYVQFAGHDPAVVPQSGGRATVFGYQLYVKKAPTVNLQDERGQQIAALSPDRAGSDDQFAVTISGETLVHYAGKSLILAITTHKPKLVGESTSNLKLALVVPQAFQTKYKVTAHVTYSCHTTVSVNLPPEGFHADNSDCGGGSNVNQVRTPLLPSGPGISDASIIGIHYASGPETVNTTHVEPNYTATTVSISGSLDSATCENFGPVHHLNHATVWGASIVPEVRYTQEIDHNQSVGPMVLNVDLPTTNANLPIPSSCFEPGSKTFSYSIVPVIDGVEQKPLYLSPNQTGSEHGVSDQGSVGGVAISGQWNPNPVEGFTQVSVSLQAPACGN
jgi:hypothetical protein